MTHRPPLDGPGRRAFLKRLAAATGTLLIGRQALASDAPQTDRRIGVQLYTLRDRMQEDFEGTLERVAALGYREVEFAGYYDRSPDQVRAILDRLGLAAPSAHVSLDLLRDDLEGQIASAQTIGHRYLTVPVLMDGFRGTMTPASWTQYAAEFNRIGEALRNAGLRFAYHNHAFEFVPAGEDRTGFDVLLQETDPELVAFELDLMWAVVGGQQPLDLIRRYPGRFEMWHVKDIRDVAGAREANGKGMAGMRDIMQRITAVGEGEIDFAAIFAREQESGLRHFFVENDAPADPIANIETSFRNLSALLDG